MYKHTVVQQNKHHHMNKNAQWLSFEWCHTSGFHPQTQKLEPPYTAMPLARRVARCPVEANFLTKFTKNAPKLLKFCWETCIEDTHFNISG